MSEQLFDEICERIDVLLDTVRYTSFAKNVSYDNIGSLFEEAEEVRSLAVQDAPKGMVWTAYENLEALAEAMMEGEVTA